MTEKSVVQALADVMRGVGSIAKRERNQSQNFNFRGIDSVINAVGPVLRDHGVIFVPVAQSITSEQYETRNKAVMRNVVVRVEWTIYGPDGSSITACTYGEAADSGDKAVSKAHSVAYRTALLQTLCIPTDDPDPDADVHQRAQREPHHDQQPPAYDPVQQEKARLWAKARETRPDLATDALGAWLTEFAAGIGANLNNRDDLRRVFFSLPSGQPDQDQQQPPEPPATVATGRGTGPGSSVPQQGMIHGELTRIGVKDRDQRMIYVSTLAGRKIDSTKELTVGEASKMIDSLKHVSDLDGLDQMANSDELPLGGDQ